jgi:hypothetical protein
LRESGWDLRKAVHSLGLELPSPYEVKVRGGPDPESLRGELEARRRLLRDDISRLVEYEAEKMESERRLIDLARKLAGRSPQ